LERVKLIIPLQPLKRGEVHTKGFYRGIKKAEKYFLILKKHYLCGLQSGEILWILWLSRAWS
jgi:hypothetical protein